MSAVRDERQEPVPLWVMAEGLSSSADADVFFQKFAQAWAKQELAEGHARAVFNTGLQALVAATQNDPKAAEEIIIRHILPICFEQESPVDSRFFGHDHLREFVATWIERYPDERKIGLRKRILGASLDAIGTRYARPALWTIAAIGLREPGIEQSLIQLSERLDDLGDTAITCLAALQPEGKVRAKTIRKILHRLPHRPFDALAFAFQELADPRFVPVLSRRLSEKTGEAWQEVGLLGRIADRAPGDELLQKRIWRVIEQSTRSDQKVRGSALITGNGIAACNAPGVVPWLVGCLEKPGTNVNLVYNRLKECVRPEQLAGWRLLDPSGLKSTLTLHATLPGGQTRFMTLESHIRHFAWETALSGGITDIGDWLTTVLSDGASQYGQHDVLSFASYLRLASWPEIVNQLVRERVDVTQGSDDPVIARISAVQILRGAASKEAFGTLLDCGLTANGAPLRSAAEAAGRLAEHVAQEDSDFVISRLLAACESRETGERRMLAVAGLQRLAYRHRLPKETLHRLLLIAQDESLPPYATAAMIWCISWFPEAATLSSFAAFLLRQIDGSHVDPDIKFQSIQALVHFGTWKQYERNILQALDLHESGALLLPMEVSSLQGWQAHILALLAVRELQRFVAAAKDILLNANGSVVHVMLQALSNASKKDRHSATEIGVAAIERSRRVLGRSFGETDNFTLISGLAPSQFVSADWEDQWKDWMPAVRAALADSLQAVFVALSVAQKNRVCDLLEALLSDSTYQVRRAAARSFSRLDAGRFGNLCDRWIHSGQTELRLRSAEMAQWMLPSDSDHLDNAILRNLTRDPEPSVRSASIRSCEEMRNRLWRAVLLERVATGDRQDGNKWLSEAYCYGRALTIIGDDETIDAVKVLRSQSDTPPNVQNWLEAIAADLEKHWRDVTRNWPEPWLPWTGQLEEIEGVVTLAGKQFTTKLSLWCRRQEDPTDTSSWGGGFATSSPFDILREFSREQSDPIPIGIEGRRNANVWLSATGIDGYVLFIGTGPYPDRI